MRHLSLVPPPAELRNVPKAVTGRRPQFSAEPVAYVPVKLLLAASGHCSCDECCQAAVRSRETTTAKPVRPACEPNRQPVCNLHLLS
jgi:hypothetical protein